MNDLSMPQTSHTQGARLRSNHVTLVTLSFLTLLMAACGPVTPV